MNQNDINLVGDYSNFMEEYIDADLEHYGVPRMRWHHRRWQYEDGSLTPAGREHYGVGPPRAIDPEHPITSRMAKAAQGFQERRAIAKIYAEKEARDKRLQEGKKAAKLKREQRAKEVKEMTRTPEDLVKNRDKLTDEEFKAAVDKFEKLKQIDTDNQALLKRYNGLKDDTPKDESDDDEDDYTDPLAGQHWGMARARKYQNPDGTLTEEGKDKFLNDSRAAKVAKWTQTAEDLVKNRDRLTEEEFKEAVIRFDRERTKKAENEAILRAFGGASEFEKRRQARSAEKIAKAYREYNAKELLKHKGEFTKEEFDQLKVLVASKSTSDLKKLTTYLSADEYQTALDRYSKTEGARKGQVVQDIKNTGANIKSVVDMIDQGYKVMDNASKLTTGRTISDLAKNATGEKFMSLLERAELGNAMNKAKASKVAADSAEAVVEGVKDVMSRAKNMSDKEYAEAMAPYYDDIMDILRGNSGGKNDKKNNKGDKNQNTQDNPQQQPKQEKKEKQSQDNPQQPKQEKKEKQSQDNPQQPKQEKKEKQSQDNPKQEKKKEKQSQDNPQQPKQEKNVGHTFKDVIFGKNDTSNLETEFDRAFRNVDTNSSTIYPNVSAKDKRNKKVTESAWDVAPSLSAPTLSFDSPKSSKKETDYTPTLTFGDDSDPAPKAKPMTDKEYNDVMNKITNDVADFNRKTSGADPINFVLTDEDLDNFFKSFKRR